jgi:hypothetical protein
MVPHLRRQFNDDFTDGKYRRLLDGLDATVGMHIEFRICETPLFLPHPFLQKLVKAGREIIEQLAGNEDYLERSRDIVPDAFRVPEDSDHPLFLALDFGVTVGDAGKLELQLIELQGFPSLYAYQVSLCEAYVETYGLDDRLQWYLEGLDRKTYFDLFRRAVVASHDPAHVVLLELDPDRQKTRPDFVLTERALGIRTVNIREVVVQGRSLFYRDYGRLQVIKRIYHRAIVDELLQKKVPVPFDYRKELDVEWAGHPNWFFRMSKFSLPFLEHRAVPKAFFLSELSELPADTENWVLKPLFSFAGCGVVVGPTRGELDSIPSKERQNYILQRKVDYGGLVETPHGRTKAEIRILYIWVDDLKPVLTLVRMGRGKMMGVDHNKNMAWVGSSAGLHMGLEP